LSIFENLSRKFQVSLQSDKINGCSAWRPACSYGSIWLNYA